MVTEIPEQPADPVLDPIWEGDLLFRRSEAAQLIAYIESIANRPSIREDKRAYTIAVDARYGEGKTFFLKRLAQQMAIDHPVAFVDAWADDLANEPLTALAATLKEALDPFLKDADVRSKFDDFMVKTGKVATIVGKGLLRRGIGFAIGATAVEGTEAVLSGVSAEATDALEEASKGLAEDAGEAMHSVTSHSLMEKRVADFEEGQAAVQAMKDSLSAIVASLGDTDRKAPIVIVIDELDRCRPTYAIKLLEEIKHLFDVPGLVFVLAIHGEQLGHSVSGAYGPSFDGRAYLRRFVDREYRLKEPRLEHLLSKLLAPYQFDNIMKRPPVLNQDKEEAKLSLAELLAEYMRLYGLGARDAFQLVDILQTSIALARGQGLEAAYFIPLAIGHLNHTPRGELPTPEHRSKYVYLPNWSRQNSSDVTEMSLPDLAQAIKSELGKGWQYYQNKREPSDRTYVVQVGARDDSSNHGGILDWSPSGYPRLLEAVGRFANPQLDGPETPQR